MSRIGKLPVAIPAGVTVEIKDNVVKVKGPKGTLERTFAKEITIKEEDYPELYCSTWLKV